MLSRVDLPALPGGGALSGSPAKSAPLLPEEPEAPAEVASSNGAGAAAPAAAPPEPGGGEGGGGKAGKEPLAPELAKAAGKGGEEPLAPELAKAAGKGGAGGSAPAGSPERADGPDAGGPRGNRMPEGEIKLTASKGGEPEGNAPAAPAAPVADAPAPAGTVRAEDVDPSTLGQDGSGGKPTPEGLALLENKNIVL